MELILYGSGKRCKMLLDIIEKYEYKVDAIVDSNEEKWGVKINGYEISPPSILKKSHNKYICVTFYSSFIVDSVWEQLDEFGIKKEYILTFHELLFNIYHKQFINNDYKKFKINNKKIIFDGSWKLGLGGVESWLRVVVTGLYDSKVYIATESSDFNENQVVRFALSEQSNFSYESVDNCYKFVISRLPCTFVFSRVNELLLVASIIKKKYPNKLKIIMAVHGSCDGMYNDILSYRSYIDYYVVVSSGIKNALEKYGIDENKIEMMTCPVSYKKCIKRRNDNKHPILIGYAGRIEIFEKRMDVLKNVILNLERKKIHYILSIAGDGSYFNELESFIFEKKLHDKIILLGQISHQKIADFWIKQDIAINTSDNEGRPLSNMEAMINGAVPVVTNTVGIRDDVHDNVNGFIVPIEDAKLLAERIEYLHYNRDVLKKFSVAAKNEMIKKINLNSHVLQWKKIFEKVDFV